MNVHAHAGDPVINQLVVKGDPDAVNVTVPTSHLDGRPWASVRFGPATFFLTLRADDGYRPGLTVKFDPTAQAAIDDAAEQLRVAMVRDHDDAEAAAAVAAEDAFALLDEEGAA